MPFLVESRFSEVEPPGETKIEIKPEFREVGGKIREKYFPRKTKVGSRKLIGSFEKPRDWEIGIRTVDHCQTVQNGAKCGVCYLTFAILLINFLLANLILYLVSGHSARVRFSLGTRPKKLFPKHPRQSSATVSVPRPEGNLGIFDSQCLNTALTFWALGYQVWTRPEGLDHHNRQSVLKVLKEILGIFGGQGWGRETSSQGAFHFKVGGESALGTRLELYACFEPR